MPDPCTIALQTDKQLMAIHTQREQLMEDIDCIVESYYFDKPLEWQFTADDCVELTRILCDAVCKNFPTK